MVTHEIFGLIIRKYMMFLKHTETIYKKEPCPGELSKL